MSDLPDTRELMESLLANLAEEIPKEEKAMLALYARSLDSERWSAETGKKLLASLRTIPREEWDRIPELAIPARMVLSIVALFLSKLRKTSNQQLAWEMIQAGDKALRKALASYEHDEGQQLTAVASWSIREAIQEVVVTSSALTSSR